MLGRTLTGESVEMTESTIDVAAVSVSIVVPVYSGEAYIERLVEAVDGLREEWLGSDAPVAVAELIMVDDNAIDGSAAIMDRLAKDRPWLVALHLSRNFGQHGATIAGILHSAGDWVVTLDEDLQHPPERIGELLKKAVGNGSDVVYARPEGNVHGAMVRDSTSRGFKRLMEWLTGNPNIHNINSFRLIRGVIARAAASVCMHDTFFDINLSWYTQRIAVVPMTLTDERYQQTGKSGYRLRSLFSHAWRMLFSSHLKVLKLGALFGFGVLSFSILSTLVLIFLKLAVPGAVQEAGWTSIMLAILFFGGLSVLMLGVSLQYLSTLVLRAHGKPVFFPIDRSQDAPLLEYFKD